MLPAIRLIGFGLRQVIGMVPEAQTRDALGRVTGSIIQNVVRHFTDHSQTLPKALARANDLAWQAVSIALAGTGLVDQIKGFFASADDKGIREQVRLLLQDKSIGFEGSSDDFRKKCLVELNQARKAGLLSAEICEPKQVAQQAAGFQRYGDPKSMVNGAEQVIKQIADDLASQYRNLATLLGHRPSSGGPPLLVSAFMFFFRREVETNHELAHGLNFDGIRQLSAAQEKAFEQAFEQLDRIESGVVEATEAIRDVRTDFVEVRQAVLDMYAETQRLGDTLADQVARRMEKVVGDLAIRAGMQKGEVKPHHGFSIRSDDERVAVKQLLARFRQIPVEQQKQLPALLNGLGKLQYGIGDFDGARESFEEVASTVSDTTAQAEAQFNVYSAALEKKNWDDALDALQEAAALDFHRFGLFPMERYEPIRILGAGGFGTAFLCYDQDDEEKVVVKTFHAEHLERRTKDVFRETRLLRKLIHPSIIGIREGGQYTDPVKQTHPFIVLDYFPGDSLEEVIQENGDFSGAIWVWQGVEVFRQIAQGMHAAHQQNVLHRDLKPDNVLVCTERRPWKVKIIDFGLAMQKQTIETSMAARSAGNTILNDSVAGTIKYAPPEQMGEMKGVKPGPYSDVYSFGKLCCYALFKTTEPRRRQWAEIPENLAEMLESCIEHDLEHRLPSFEPVLKVLDEILAQHWDAWSSGVKKNWNWNASKSKQAHDRCDLVKYSELQRLVEWQKQDGYSPDPEILDFLALPEVGNELNEEEFLRFIDYLYEPGQPEETLPHIEQRIQTWLNSFEDQKTALRPYLDQFLSHARCHPTNKNTTVARLVGDFLRRAQF